MLDEIYLYIINISGTLVHGGFCECFDCFHVCKMVTSGMLLSPAYARRVLVISTVCACVHVSV